jgi:tetratricopeptide (TPR) repeat protein
MSQTFSGSLICGLILSGCAWFLSCSPAKAGNRPQQGASALPAKQEQAQQALNQGVQAFKEAQFDRAIELFAKAKELNPSLMNAQLYLATAYASRYIPGAPSEENVRMGKLATDAYKDVLQREPQNLSAIDGLASILYQRAGQPFDADMFAESKSYQQKHIELRPQDPQPYYSIGVIDWALSYRGNTRLRQAFNESVGGEGLQDADPLPEVLRVEYVGEFGGMIEEGIQVLTRAIELKPEYDDAMVYLNLLYRRKADTVDSPAERARLTEMADELVDKVKEIKIKRIEMQN